MKAQLPKNTVITCVTVLLISTSINTNAQNAGNLLRAGGDNANKLINAYMSSTMSSVGQGLNDSWNNTAKPLGLWGLDLRLNAGIGFVAAKDQSFDFNAFAKGNSESNTYLVLDKGVSSNRPTIWGASEPSAPRVNVRSNVGGMDTALASFTMPSGTGLGYSPSLPMIQLSVGLYKNTELSLRYFPQSTFAQDYSMGLFGMGIKHDIMQWIPYYRHLKQDVKRPFDCSVFLGFTNFNTGFKKTLLTVDPQAYNPNPSYTYDNQKITFGGNTWTAGIIASKEFRPFKYNISFTPYMGINYSYSLVKLQFEGDFPIPVANDQYSAAHPQVTRIEKVTNPVSVQSEVSTARVNGGVRIKIYAYTMFSEFSIGQFNTLTFGLGVNLQSLKPYQL